MWLSAKVRSRPSSVTPRREKTAPALLISTSMRGSAAAISEPTRFISPSRTGRRNRRCGSRRATPPEAMPVSSPRVPYRVPAARGFSFGKPSHPTPGGSAAMTDSHRPVTGAQALVRSLEAVGVEVVFGIPGGAILPAYDPLIDSTRSGTSWSATSRAPATPPQGYAQATGKVGRLHGDVRARARPTWSRRSPTPTWTRSRWSRSPARSAAALIGTDAFQEADIRGITMPITKHNFLVTDPAEIPRAIAEAFHIAAHRPARPGAGRHPEGRAAGADHVQLAADDRPARLPADHAAARQADPRGGPADRRGAAAGALRRRRRASRRGRAARAAAQLAELTGIPVVTTLMARGAFPDSHPQHLGMPGMHGTVAAVGGAAEAPTCSSRSAPASTTG